MIPRNGNGIFVERFLGNHDKEVQSCTVWSDPKRPIGERGNREPYDEALILFGNNKGNKPADGASADESGGEKSRA